MKAKQWLAIVGAFGVAAGAGGCAPKPAEGAAPPNAGSASQDTTSVESYLAKGGPVDKFDKKVIAAICQLEQANKKYIDQTKRLCPEGDPNKVVNPTYPPP
jgi:hypothetical protein